MDKEVKNRLKEELKDKYYTTSQVAKIFDKTIPTIFNWSEKYDNFPAPYRPYFSRTYYFKKSDIINFKNESFFFGKHKHIKINKGQQEFLNSLLMKRSDNE